MGMSLVHLRISLLSCYCYQFHIGQDLGLLTESYFLGLLVLQRTLRTQNQDILIGFICFDCSK